MSDHDFKPSGFSWMLQDASEPSQMPLSMHSLMASSNRMIHALNESAACSFAVFCRSCIRNRSETSNVRGHSVAGSRRSVTASV